MDEVTSKGGSKLVGIFFFGADWRDEFDVSDIFKSVLWYLAFVDEEYGVCSLYSSTYSLC